MRAWFERPASSAAVADRRASEGADAGRDLRGRARPAYSNRPLHEISPAKVDLCSMAGMVTRRSAADIGLARARELQRRVGEELRVARTSAGLSQASAGASAAMSHAQWSRLERASLLDVSFGQASRAATAVGLRLDVRCYPDGDPVRDAGQLALLERFRRRLPPGTRWETEVPLPIPGDRRAWDALVGLRGRRAGCEGETRLGDLQALERRLRLKLRDGGVDVLIVIVADTVSNRRVLDAYREVLRSLLPLDGRHVLASLRAGVLPDRNGLVLL